MLPAAAVFPIAGEPVAPNALEYALQVSRPTINRDLRDLLRDSRDIDGSVYTPSSIPSLLEETLKAIVDKVRNIRNPVEAAFADVQVDAADSAASLILLHILLFVAPAVAP